MRKAFIALIPILGIAAIARAQTPSPKETDVRADIVYLASDDLEGRATGSRGGLLAANYIASRFDRIGLRPAGTDGWFQDFTFDTFPNPHDSTMSVSVQGRNVVGLLDVGSDLTVVVGAHYDHLGYGGSGSRAPGDSLIHNGADDNASGVAGLLEMARLLSVDRPQSTNVLFIAFSGEELGLLGSKYFVSHPTIGLDRIKYMINLDMVGRLRESLIVGGAGTSPVWIPLIDSLATGEFEVKIDSSGLGPSDHASFYLNDIPSLHFFTGQHADYHKPSDDSGFINYDGILKVASLGAEIVKALDTPAPIAFTKTADRSPRRAAAFKVSLGVMPDYAYSGKGLRIDAVLDDRPASIAGLENGDVVVEIGGEEIGDIYKYMEALGKYDRGDKVNVVVQRGDDRITVEVEF